MASVSPGFSRLIVCMVIAFAVFGVAGRVSAQTVQLVPSATTVTPDTSFSVAVNISGATNVFGVSFNIVFNPALINFTGAVEGSFLSGCQTTLFTTEQPAGTLIGGLSKIGLTCSGSSGAGTLMTLNFKTLTTAGPVPIGFTTGGNNFCILTAGQYFCNFVPGTWTGTSVTIAGSAPAAPQDTTAPVFSSVSATSITANTALITWVTNEAATTLVEYGPSTGFGSQTSESSSLTTMHSMLVGGLNPSTIYHYRVKSTDASGNQGMAGNYNFMTTAQQVVAPPPTNTNNQYQNTNTNNQTQNNEGVVLIARNDPYANISSSTYRLPPGVSNYVAVPLQANLSPGMRGASVQNLQNFLLAEKYVLNSQLVSERGYYGPNTEDAVRAFQRANKIITFGTPNTTGYGSVGLTTRTKMNEVINSRIVALAAAVQPAPTPATNKPTSGTSTSRPATGTGKFQFTRTLQVGSVGEDVRRLQILLNSQGFIIASSGPGSKGQETTSFGPSTARALSRFQEYYRKDILTPNGLTRGTGSFGPTSIRKANQLLK